MDPKDKIDSNLLEFLSATKKSQLISILVKTVDGLREEDSKLIHSRGGHIKDKLYIINCYSADVPADISVIEDIARDPRVIHISLDASWVMGMKRVIIHTVKGIAEEEKKFLHSGGGKIIAEFQSIKSYIVDLPMTSGVQLVPDPKSGGFIANIFRIPVAIELERKNPELTINYNAPNELSISDLLKGAKVISSFEDFLKEAEIIGQSKKG